MARAFVEDIIVFPSACEAQRSTSGTPPPGLDQQTVSRPVEK
jgi:hypothetical protein